MTVNAHLLMQSTIARIACTEHTASHLHSLRASIGQACSLPPDADWERKAAAHARFHCLLADATGAPGFSLLARCIGDSLRDMIILAGPAAEDDIIASRHRLLSHLEARNAEAASKEMLSYLSRLQAIKTR
jgi:GntR family transcriptional regulator, transcriptional repressor for pyruvate dehydrogenase complex